ncbi:DeoR/GlpR transcriptional regulator [Carnobacteriaceae bacterium zg-C25]|nr:DeoR/GlpR transcriptional regulator [Carnobacteriaceae bacterium zg-C25]
MLAKQRHDYILNEVQTKGSVLLTHLTKVLNSSTATIRRDLQHLEDHGLLTRVHGGAVRRQNTLELSVSEKAAYQVLPKQRIAQYVSDKYIQDDTLIYLDAGSTTHALIPYLTNRHITVVTNGVHHIDALIANGISSILLGGHIKHNTLAVVGSAASEQLDHYHFDVAILGSNCVDLSIGCSTPDEREAILKRKARVRSKQAIVMVDETKFNTQTHFAFATLDDVVIVTDNAPMDYTTVERII